MSSLTRVFQHIRDILFPRECVSCGHAGNWLCDKCQSSLPVLPPTCPVCRRVMPGGRTHTECIKEFSLEGCIAAASLSLAPVQALVYGCKYHGLRSAASALATLTLRASESSPLFSTFTATARPTICPVPLHAQRLRKRGFNQSELIGRALADLLRLPFLSLLTRVRPTADQVSLTREKRRQNLAEAFIISSNVAKLPSSLILIDDVVTTGATLHAAASALRKAQKDITIWGLATAYHATSD